MYYKINSKLFETLTNDKIKDLKDYYKVLELSKRGLSRKEIKNHIKTSRDKLYQWRYTAMKPTSVKTIEGFHQRYNKKFGKKELENLSYLIGYNLGDGNISKNFCNAWFYGVYDDLLDIKEVLLKFDVKPVIYNYKINNGKMAVHDRIFTRLLYLFGGVSGDKTKNRVSIPKWILKSNKKIKVKFLQGLFDSELSKLKLIKNKSSYQSLKFYNCKQIGKVDDGIFFLNQIRGLLKEFNIKTSRVAFDRQYFRSRDNSKMQQLYFLIKSNYINLYNFITKIGFLHNSKRREAIMKNAAFIKKQALIEEKRIKDYNKVLKLWKNNLSPYTIAKKLKLKPHIVKQWTYYKNKPRLFDFYSSNS